MRPIKSGFQRAQGRWIDPSAAETDVDRPGGGRQFPVAGGVADRNTHSRRGYE